MRDNKEGLKDLPIKMNPFDESKAEPKLLVKLPVD